MAALRKTTAGAASSAPTTGENLTKRRRLLRFCRLERDSDEASFEVGSLRFFKRRLHVRGTSSAQKVYAYGGAGFAEIRIHGGERHAEALGQGEI
jgi:hypothetical protein